MMYNITKSRHIDYNNYFEAYGMSVILNIKEAAHYLQINDQTLRKMARQGSIPAFKVGRSWRLSKDILNKWIDSHNDKKHDATLLYLYNFDDDLIKHINDIVCHSNIEIVIANNNPKIMDCPFQMTPSLVFINIQSSRTNNDMSIIHKAYINFSKIPIVVFASKSDYSIISETFKYTPFILLSKPFTKEQLMTCINIYARK